MIRALWRWVGATGNGRTQNRDYEAFMSPTGSFMIVNDDGRLSAVGEGSSDWMLLRIIIDGDVFFQHEESDNGEQSNGAEGRDAAKDKEAEARRPGTDEENREGRTDEGQRG